MSEQDSYHSKSLLVCGLPESGKTTFMGALAYLLGSGEVNTQLQFDELADDRAYFNELSGLWARCENMHRTPISDTHDNLILHLAHGRDRIRMVIPDLSGETWINLWTNRQCSAAVVELARNAEGILFFLHSDRIKQPVSLTDYLAQVRLIEGHDTPRPEKPWEPSKDTATQAIVVDLLQMLARPPLCTSPRRLALVLSAWDRVDGDPNPEAYLQCAFPLLDQYLNSALDYPQWTVSGISALGGDLASDADRLSAMNNPSDRITVKRSNKANRDLTAPIWWLLAP